MTSYLHNKNTLFYTLIVCLIVLINSNGNSKLQYDLNQLSSIIELKPNTN